MEKDINVVDDVVADVTNDAEVVEIGTMTAKEFVALYDSDTTKNKTAVAKELKVTPYINYEEKIALAENIVNSANINKETGNIVLNSPLRFVFFVFTVINKYTNVRLGAGGMLDDFNTLNSHGLVEYLMKQIPEKELSEFTTVVDMVADDLMTNKYEPHAYVNNVLEKILNLLNPAIDVLNNLSEQIKDVDFDELTKKLEEMAEKAE